MPTIYLPPKKVYKTQKRSYKTISKRDNLNHIAVYNTTQWRSLRLEKIKESPLCEVCFARGVITSGIDVHHIIPISNGATIRDKQIIGFDKTNLKTLCKQCHKDQHI